MSERITEDEHAATASVCAICGIRARGMQDDGWHCDGCEALLADDEGLPSDTKEDTTP